MKEELTEDEKFVREELTKTWKQLQINERKILGDAYEKYKGDLMGLAVTFFLEKPIEQQLKTIREGKLENFITFIANMQAKRATTRFYKEHRRFTESSIDFNDYEEDDVEVYEEGYFESDERIRCLKKAIEELDPFEKMLVQERFINRMPTEDLMARYGLPRGAIVVGVQKTKNKLKRLCKHLL